MYLINPLTHILVYRKLLPYRIRAAIYKLILSCKNLIIGKHVVVKPLRNKVEELNKDGFLKLDAIDENKIKEILSDIKQMPIRKIQNSRGELVKEVYCNSNLVESQALLSLATDNDLLSVLSEYFGCLPKIQYLAAWRTLKNEDELSEMFFHMDHHGHKFVKLFLYLSDVDEGDGHHEFVKGSHDWLNFNKVLSPKKMQNIRNQVIAKRKWKGSFWMNNEAVSQFLQDRLLRVTGRAGALFMEDTGGLHRGTKVVSGKPRLLFQVLYTAIDSGKDPCVKGENRTAFEICRSASNLDDKKFNNVCSLIFK